MKFTFSTLLPLLTIPALLAPRFVSARCTHSRTFNTTQTFNNTLSRRGLYDPDHDPYPQDWELGGPFRGDPPNCKGSFNCIDDSDDGSSNIKEVSTLLKAYIDELGDDTWANEEEHIACARVTSETEATDLYFCAFLQLSFGCFGYYLKQMARDMITGGCETCGTLAIFDYFEHMPGSLTYNYVAHPTCVGRCIDVKGQRESIKWGKIYP